MKLVNSNSRQARLADVRILIERDPFARWPNEEMDMLFKPGHGEVFGFKLKDSGTRAEEFVFTADRAKLEAECPEGRDFNEWLAGIKAAESKIYQDFIDGNVYMLIVQKWNAAERQFDTLDSACKLFGWDDVKENVKDFADKYKPSAICVNEAELGDVDSWRAEFQNI